MQRVAGIRGTGGGGFQFSQIDSLDDQALQFGQLIGARVGVGLEAGEYRFVEQHLGVFSEPQLVTVVEFELYLGADAGGEDIAFVNRVADTQDSDNAIDAAYLCVTLQIGDITNAFRSHISAEN